MSSEQPVIHPYRAEWVWEAADLTGALAVALGELATRIDHIGSTAIPSMPAKDIIDLQISVKELDRAAAAFDAPLKVLGFRRSPIEFDHVPAGGHDDPDDWAKRLWLRRDPSAHKVNLHVRRSGAANERMSLLFRDWFRAHPEAIPSYGRFKRYLAEVVEDTDTYAGIKDPVVDLVSVVAESWAALSGWDPDLVEGGT